MNTSSMIPSFWKPELVGKDPHRKPNLALAAAEGMRISSHLEPVSRQINRGDTHGLVIIDPEKDFGDDGRLPVAGTFADIGRLGDRIVRGILEQRYTQVIITVDKHPPFHISGPAWWRTVDGNELPILQGDPMILTLVDDSDPRRPIFEGLHVVSGRKVKYYPYVNMKDKKSGLPHAVVYFNHLKALGEPGIWVFTEHCIEGTDGINIIPELAELIMWASLARNIQPIYLYKGMIAQVDFFGPFRPCMDVDDHPQGSWQTTYLDMIPNCKTTDISGEAEDFCVRNGVQQVIEYFGTRPDVLSNVRFLGDCTSAIVPGGDAVKGLHKLMAEKGIKVIKAESAF